MKMKLFKSREERRLEKEAKEREAYAKAHPVKSKIRNAGNALKCMPVSDAITITTASLGAVTSGYAAFRIFAGIASSNRTTEQVVDAICSDLSNDPKVTRKTIDRQRGHILNNATMQKNVAIEDRGDVAYKVLLTMKQMYILQDIQASKVKKANIEAYVNNHELARGMSRGEVKKFVKMVDKTIGK